MSDTVLHNGQRVDYDAAVALMDDDLRENLHHSINYWVQDQVFFDLYRVAHYVKFGEEFTVN